MSPGIRVYVNEQPVSVGVGASIEEAVAAFDEELAAKLKRGAAYATDGVGRRAPITGLVEPGAIIRVITSE